MNLCKGAAWTVTSLQDYNARISSFSVAKIDSPDFDYEAHPIKYEKGRHVYATPEYFLEGGFCLKSDVYGFDVVLVQMLTGVDAYLPSFRKIGLLSLNASRIANAKVLGKVMDVRLEGKYPLEAAVKMAQLAVQCLQYKSKYRLSMEQVVDVLESIES